jgi:hypothetical protein
MGMSVIIFIIVVLIVTIWIIFGFKKVKHKFFALFLIALILFSFFSFNAAFGGKDISINSISDLGGVAKLYFSWLVNVFNNMKVITTQAVKMDWRGNETT